MTTQQILHAADRLSTWTGKTFAWLIVALMLVVCAEVFKRYALNAPTAWIYDVNNMMYGTLFMMCGAYTLSQDGHVRGDFLYGSMKPRTQATLDLVLYIAFFLPGIGALTWAGWGYYQDSLAMHEQTFNATPLPVYPFKFVIPVAGAIVMLQGLAEILRCVVCLRTGEWTPRLKDAEEMDVVEQQLASSTFVDEEARRDVIERAKDVDEAARHRGRESV
ncbi:TRAP transporter small permease subunit [Variovorax sp. J22P240]|uniref:TRAP transporter small permease subunit n=1 Tax=unclassified Variovorax TaxID=663243 RepID=UPI002574D5DB|nr:MULTISPECIES: TRAP transporter small permease subunit [unclassified Variovorax]MDM0000166.1 TRAP transporter small permease subunit [Variovorax sp. J22P240]MDM0050317.1 TRAP transporter small permease subunit [Variovorax sp. J22R115]